MPWQCTLLHAVQHGSHVCLCLARAIPSVHWPTTDARCNAMPLQVQAQVDRLSALITAARAGASGAAASPPAPAKQAAKGKATASDGQKDSKGGTKRAAIDGLSRQPKKQKSKQKQQVADAA
jgi:hypothetical protein